MKKFLSPVALIALAIVLCAFFRRAPGKTPSDIFLSPTDQIEGSPFFSKVLESDKDFVRERAKIEYLISRIRRSSYTFIRNGKSYNGLKAARHLTTKYHRRFGAIKSAVDFIENVATRSSTTGEAYVVRFPDGRIYPAADVLLNELSVLETYLLTSDSRS